MTLVEIVNAPELTDIVGSAPDTKQEEIALQLLSVARRLTGTDCHDSCETQVRLEQIKGDLPRILRELVRIARVLADNERAEVPTVADIQRAWNITPTPKLVRKVTTSEHLENLDKIHMLSLLNDLLPRQEAAVRKIYSELLREFSYDSCPEMSDEELRAEVTRRCQEKVREWQRLNLSKEEQWYEGRKRKGDIPTRVEFLKRVGLAKTPLECIERRDGESFYSLASI